MPTAPLNKKCEELGCKNERTSKSVFCLDHGGGLNDRNKKNNKLYNARFWKKQRSIQLSKNPLCAACLIDGRVVQAEHIDHVFPHRQDNDKFRINLFQSLCASHHSEKTQEEFLGRYIYYSSNGIITYTDQDYGDQVINEANTTQII